MRRLHAQDDLSVEVFRANRSIDPDQQIDVAKYFWELDVRTARDWNWIRLPNYEQLQLCCRLIFDKLGGARCGSGSARSAAQLAFFLNKLRQKPSMSEFIRLQSGGASEAVSRSLDFLRLWAEFNFPRLLRGIDRIQKEVFIRRGLPTGDYRHYAGLVESLFLDPVLPAMEEFGLPLPLSRKLESVLATGGDIDEALRRLSQLDTESLELSDFEKELLVSCQPSVVHK